MKRLALAILVATTAPAHAISGNDLHELFQGSHAERMMALYYVTGVVESVSVPETGVRPMICPPDGARPSQAADIIKKKLEDEPQIRHRDGVVLVTMLLGDVWPCMH